MAGKPSVYAASVNPPRSAKQRPRSLSESSSASEYTPEPRRVVPLSPKASKAAASMDRADAEPSSTGGAKRGRKPATLSRTAREAQRKLNHSIIEKARRTKINDALATLKQLVPANYGQQPTPPADEEDNEAADEDYDGKKTPKKGTGKREEKEKEFKLEILVRTVSFMQDLIERVAALEKANKSSSCANCAGPSSSSLKRKRSVEAGEGEEKDSGPVSKRHEADPAPVAMAHPSPSIRPEASPSLHPTTYTGARLPPISSWLPQTSMRPSPRASPEFQSHLPSPPSSTQFAPARAPSQLPPALNLGPIATQALLSARTPEDESAASLLLEISASSPTFHESKAVSAPRQIQTPASLLGLISN
ncbi:BHLH domain-containing protein [Mycena venus]|uniref:BHLH domain-containing protein n=1 Tax=Mycena venus TaxID=2733690 RepID=A0A8H6YNZ1_9AGAR|nr:BHLH domain-containing protein [Mycena venus]